ncbi:MAG: CsgG/HfaB family protein [Pyramidobacter sp.]|jgi:curli biogenesis system outer membrane secretion channel CsgG
MIAPARTQKHLRRLLEALCAATALCLAAAPARAAVRVGVDTFRCTAPNVPASVADGMTELFITELVNSGTFQVFERTQLEKVAKEQRLSMSGLVSEATLAKVGRLTGVEWIITGSVTQYSQQSTGGVMPLSGFGIALVNGVGTATLDIRAIDTTTGAVKYAIRESGKAANNAVGAVIDDSVIGTGDFSGLPAKAALKAVKRVVRELERRIGGVEYHVIKVEPKQVYIDIGTAKGAAKGDLFGVYEEGEPILAPDGAVLGTDQVYHALIKVVKAEPKYSICRYVPKKGTAASIRVGDLLERVEPGKEARALVVTDERVIKDLPVLSGDEEASDPMSQPTPQKPSGNTKEPVAKGAKMTTQK